MTVSSSTRRLKASCVVTWVEVVPEIPKTASGKPLERYLVDMFEERRERVFTGQV
ncbi:hypothetical protein LMG28614_02941 [Paraburkholderia ultramafica]|uniref:AMP-binding enzyme C-terminal domain-containing protein n=1 Tax=Paraburkholderia ultramafica TaxID=1544867 RepID=A0A6S7B6E4_9BURK|nr:hypothetical protein LMG28614_02941 [Paraburkholderia ultramafica]